MEKQPHVHAATIIEWANGAQIEYRAPDSDKWKPADLPAWIADYSYRVKPARELVETQMSDDETYRAMYSGPTTNTSALCRRQIVNVGLRHAIDNGQVVTREEFAKVAEEAKCAKNSLIAAGYTYRGGELWIPPLGPLGSDTSSLRKALRKMAREMAECSPGPGGYRLMESEVKALEKCILTRHLGADYLAVLDQVVE